MRTQQRQLLVPRCRVHLVDHRGVQRLERRKGSLRPRPRGNPRRVLEHPPDLFHELVALERIQVGDCHTAVVVPARSPARWERARRTAKKIRSGVAGLSIEDARNLKRQLA